MEIFVIVKEHLNMTAQISNKNLVLFLLERTLKIIMKAFFLDFSFIIWFLKYFDWKQWPVRHLGLIFNLINCGFDDVRSEANLI